MGAFGIYTAVVTLLLVIYYAVTISRDLFGHKGIVTEKSEVIRSGGAIGSGSSSDGGTLNADASDDSPIQVEETESGYGIKEPGKEAQVINTSGFEGASLSGGRVKGSRLDEARAAQEECQTITPHYESEKKSGDEFDEEIAELQASDMLFVDSEFPESDDYDD